MTDLSMTIIPKSDQINADDLIPGPRTIKVRKVSVDTNAAEQPVNIYFEGDNNKPFRPCKSMRRVLIQMWGSDGASYVGRSMTLYRDPNVTWGGMKVGGIRISHMEGVESDTIVVLTENKKTRRPFTVRPLRVEKRPQQPEPPHDPDTGELFDGEPSDEFAGRGSEPVTITGLDDKTARQTLAKATAWIEGKLSDQSVSDDEFAELVDRNLEWLSLLPNARANAIRRGRG